MSEKITYRSRINMTPDQQEILALRRAIDNHCEWLKRMGLIEASYYYSNARCDLLSRIEAIDKDLDQ